jgi:hypothetical protein
MMPTLIEGRSRLAFGAVLGPCWRLRLTAAPRGSMTDRRATRFFELVDPDEDLLTFTH